MTKQKNTSNKTGAEQDAEKKDKREKMLPRKPDDRDLQLSREDAKGGSPSDASVGGEEDAGVGLEFLVRKHER